MSFPMRMTSRLAFGVGVAALAGSAMAQSAPGAPGDAPTWVNAAKTGVGASYEAYVDGQYRDGGRTGDVGARRLGGVDAGDERALRCTHDRRRGGRWRRG